MSKTLPKQSSVKEDNTVDPDNGVLLGLMEHRISAVVQDLDHYRKNTFMAVETDYIIHVTCRAATGGQDELEFAFIISKTFSAFRTLADQLYDEAETYMVAAGNNVPKHIAKLAKYCDAVKRLMDSQVVEYLTKVCFPMKRVGQLSFSPYRKSLPISHFRSTTNMSKPWPSSAAKSLINFWKKPCQLSLMNLPWTLIHSLDVWLS